MVTPTTAPVASRSRGVVKPWFFHRVGELVNDAAVGIDTCPAGNVNQRWGQIPHGGLVSLGGRHYAVMVKAVRTNCHGCPP